MKNAREIELVLSNSYDIYIFSETWLKSHHSLSSILCNLLVENDAIRCDRPRRAGGGVMVALKKNLNHEIVSQKL